MTVYNKIILALWIVFVVYWAVAAIGVKRSIGPRSWWREGGLRIAVIVLLLLAFHSPGFRHALRSARPTAHIGMIEGIVGTALCTLGVALAIWARRHLGRNWGMPMSRKEEPDLVTTGPYAFLRYPIYTGILVALLGSVIGESPFWLLPFFLFGAYFIYSARREEKLMLEQFPQQYAAYMKRTKMLVPFLL